MFQDQPVTVEIAACLLAASCIVVSCLIGYFAAIWKQSWMLRAVMVVVVYLPLWLAGAEELFLLAVVQTWLIGYLVSVLRRFGIGSVQLAEKRQSTRRFSIGTLLFVTGVSAGAIVLWKSFPALNARAWVSMTVCVAAVVSFAVSAWLMVFLAWRWYWRIPLALAVALTFATLPACFDWLLLSLFENEFWWPPDPAAIWIFYTASKLPTFDWYVLGIGVTCYLAFVLLLLNFRKRLRWKTTLASVLIVLTTLMPSWTLVRLLTPPKLESLETADNAYLAIMDLSKRISASQIAIQDTSGELVELRELLQKPIAVPIHQSFFDDIGDTRTISRAIEAQGDSLIAVGKISEALDAYLLEINYGACIRRGGLLIHMLVGVACSGGGIEPLYRYRLACSNEQSKDIIGKVLALTDQLEKFDEFAQRDQAWSINQGWHPHVQHLVLELAGSQLLRGRFVSPLTHELAELRLLATEYAIIRYLDDHKSLPKQLDDLVPEYLPKKLDDPFSNAGQAFQYKVNETEFILYSVGPNGVDDGGLTPRDYPDIAVGDCDVSLKYLSEIKDAESRVAPNQASGNVESEDYGLESEIDPSGTEPPMDADER